MQVIAAVSFQIIVSDALYAEIPLAAVCSEHQRKVWPSYSVFIAITSISDHINRELRVDTKETLEC